MLDRVVLGTAQFGSMYGVNNSTGPMSLKEMQGILSLCSKNTISHLDTAYSYGDAESKLGSLGMTEFYVTTKVPSLGPELFQTGIITKYLQESLLRLNLQKVHGLMLHNAADLNQNKHLFAELAELKDDGLIGNIGVSIDDFKLLRELIDQYELDFIQCPFNILDRRLLQDNLLDDLVERNITIYARSIFLQGLLLMSQKDVPEIFAPWTSLLDSWFKWLDQNDCSAYEACLSFCLHHKKVDYFVIGVDNSEQINKLIDYSLTETMLVDALVFPDSMYSNDLGLINPSNWTRNI